MRIGIEAQRIFRPDKHGMDYVVLEVLRQLQLKNDGNEYIVFVAPGSDHCLECTPHMQIVELKCPYYPLWEQWALPRAAKHYGIEWLHCTSNTAPLYCPVPLVLTLHDIIYLTTNLEKGMSRYQQLGWHYRRWNVPRIINQCRYIITVSETERRNILKYFPNIAPRICVVHNGYSDYYHPLSEKETYSVTAQYLPDSHYLLFLGNTDPRKNTKGVLHAYNEYLKRSQQKLKLVITGLRRDYCEQLLSEMNIETCAKHLIYTGYVPGDYLPAIYNGAFAFLFPSLREGFGIPILESMACGTPVITSNTSSMPEVAGEGALLVSPYNPQEIADALLRLETDETFYQEQVDYGLLRVQQFSWAKTAEAWAQLYHNQELSHTYNTPCR